MATIGWITLLCSLLLVHVQHCLCELDESTGYDINGGSVQYVSNNQIMQEVRTMKRRLTSVENENHQFKIALQNFEKTNRILQSKLASMAVQNMVLSPAAKHDALKEYRDLNISISSFLDKAALKKYVRRQTSGYSPTFHLQNHWQAPKPTAGSHHILPKKVAFFARLFPSLSNPIDNQVIIMDDVQINEGSAFDPTTGKFTCKVPGIYVFYVNQLTFEHKSLETALVKNGVNICHIYSGNDNYYGNGSNMVVVHLDAGDIIWVRIHSGYHDTGKILDEDFTSFTGFLLYED